MRTRLCCAFCALWMGLSPSLVNADDLLGIKTDVSDLIVRAQSAGHELLADALEKVLMIIGESEEAALAIVDGAGTEADYVIGTAASELDDILDRISTSLASGQTDVHRHVASLETIVGRMPLSDGRPSIIASGPSTLVPAGAQDATLYVIGGGLGHADAAASLNGIQLEVLVISDNEIRIVVPNEMVPDPQQFPAPLHVAVTYTVAEPNWLFEFIGVKPEREARSIAATVLPRNAGQMTVTQIVGTQTVERGSVKLDGHSRGRDISPIEKFEVPADLRKQGWRIDTARVLELLSSQNGSIWRQGRGKSADVSGVVRGELSENVLPIRTSIRSRRTCDSWTCRRRDGYVHFDVYMPLIRKVDGTEKIVETVGLSWEAVAQFDLHPHHQDWEIEILSAALPASRHHASKRRLLDAPAIDLEADEHRIFVKLATPSET